MLKPTDTPNLDIRLFNQEGKQDSLRNHLGRYVLLYFYPEDETPGCTQEACSFRDNQPELSKFGIDIIGVSPDSIESHLKFYQHHRLNFNLWADPDHSLSEHFGVWRQKSLFGKKFMGVTRTTFFIDEEGKIVKVWEKVNPLLHVGQVKKFIAQLQQN